MIEPIDAPVLLLIFRRPELTARVFAAVAAARPRRLLIFADGPRPDHHDDAAACAAARAVVERVDWECEVFRYYSDVNLGCGRGPAAGITWAFAQVDEAIVLEDDCVPHPTFFRFCDELLARYRDDQRVMHIAGSIFRREPIPVETSYVFSQFNSAWGWATWRRAWERFDFSLVLWPELRPTTWLMDLLGVDEAVRYWHREFDRATAPDTSVWDHQWTFACWVNSGLSIVPRVNMVTNVGCGPDATHTFAADDPFAHVAAEAMDFPLRHPPTVRHDRAWDREFLRHVILPRLNPPTPSALRAFASRVLPAPVKRRLHALTGGRLTLRVRVS